MRAAGSKQTNVLSLQTRWMNFGVISGRLIFMKNKNQPYVAEGLQAL